MQGYGKYGNQQYSQQWNQFAASSGNAYRSEATTVGAKVTPVCQSNTEWGAKLARPTQKLEVSMGNGGGGGKGANGNAGPNVGIKNASGELFVECRCVI